MNNNRHGVFEATRSKNLVLSNTELYKYTIAAICGQLEKAKGLLLIDAEFYKEHEDKNYIASALMTLGGNLISNDETKEGSLAYFKALQIDPENETVKRFYRYFGSPKSAEDIEERLIYFEAIDNQRRKKSYKK